MSSRRVVIVLCGFILMPLTVFSGTMGHNSPTNDHSVYWGIFGGVGAHDRIYTSQSGMSYRYIGDLYPGQAAPTDVNYNLHVNVMGTSQTNNGVIAGIHVGYLMNELQFGTKTGVNLVPRIELESYYLGSKMSGTLTNPVLEPAVLRPEGTVSPANSISANQHVFVDDFNLNSGVLMLDTLFDLRTSLSQNYIPYAGVGLGVLFNTLSKANSDQIMPFNEDVNHFNSNTKASSTLLAAQTRVGLRTQIASHLSVFAEYRYIYGAASSYTFGNTYYPGLHPETSPWNVSLGSMNFQTGIIGLDYVC
ncbi:outer membrane protein [Legionella worsleiensis]|uniref:Outer membrane protein beta-barrel domain-containing protein n=1 Tax=Legionella worsleiensis TaxID=45076 RepID=A0A0W1A4G1_9GAMM|nr:hypothetical protein [Legionella worsleiensis]KTD76207.1 hypothetical protein Lwor_2325 [Legionella worsleiensis]STY33216.1 Uncharacterised protein [Legionella worsleiensis]